MALDTETQHNLVKWHPNWRSGWYTRRFSFRRTLINWRIQKDLNKVEEQASWNLKKFNKGKWKFICQGQVEGWVNNHAAAAHRTIATGHLERLQRKAAKTIRWPEHLMYKERLGKLVCLAWRWEGQEGMSVQSSATLIHWRRQIQTFLGDAQK